MKKSTVLLLLTMMLFSGLVVSAQGSRDLVALYRLLHQKSGDHLYTTSCREKDDLLRSSEWVYEGVEGYVATRSFRRTLPLYRILLASGGHFYTIDKAEVAQVLQNPQNRDEGIAGYVSERRSNDTRPFFRMFDGKFHFYTTNERERDDFQRNGGRLESDTGFLFVKGQNPCDYGTTAGGGGVGMNAPMLFEGSNFDGLSVALQGDWRENKDWDGSPNTIRSVRVPSGWYLIVYSRSNFGGRSSVISTSMTFGPRDEWYNKIRSIRVFQGVPPQR